MARITLQAVDLRRRQVSTDLGVRYAPVLNLGKPAEGDGDCDFACPKCEATVLRRVNPDAVRAMTFKCPTCGAFGCVGNKA